MCGVFPTIKGFWWTYFFAYIFFSYFLIAKLGDCPILKATLPGQHSQIANSTQQRQVGIPKLPTQHYYFAKLPSPLHPCGLPKMSFKLPTNFKKFQALNDFFWSAQNFAPENQTAPM
jgi:hypothetical protein